MNKYTISFILFLFTSIFGYSQKSAYQYLPNAKYSPIQNADLSLGFDEPTSLGFTWLGRKATLAISSTDATIFLSEIDQGMAYSTHITPLACALELEDSYINADSLEVLIDYEINASSDTISTLMQVSNYQFKNYPGTRLSFQVKFNNDNSFEVYYGPSIIAELHEPYDKMLFGWLRSDEQGAITNYLILADEVSSPTLYDFVDMQPFFEDDTIPTFRRCPQNNLSFRINSNEVSSVDENKISNQIDVTITNGILVVKDVVGPYELRILNTLGQTVYHANDLSGVQKISLQGISQQLLIVNIQSAQGAASVKVAG